MSEKILIDEFGFREYDARWLFPDNINELGIESVGKGFGTQVISKINNTSCICIFVVDPEKIFIHEILF